MPQAIAIFGFLGAWFLVAGPLLQAYLELREEEIDHESWEAANKATPKPEGFSAWWWLLPPVAWFKQQARNRQHQRDVMKLVDPHVTEQAVSFFNKANGWFVVAGGAALLAVKETWELVEAWDWPVWIFWVLVFACPILCVVNLATRVNQSERMLGHEKPPPRRRRPQKD
ncbi:MAG TPA: hypothetical protein VGM38_01165 [Pseudolysinimonas sp.]|jgi:hypothetical protein